MVKEICDNSDNNTCLNEAEVEKEIQESLNRSTKNNIKMEDVHPSVEQLQLKKQIEWTKL